jgi:hypothetical protein
MIKDCNAERLETFEPERSSALERIAENVHVHASKLKDQLYLYYYRSEVSDINIANSNKNRIEIMVLPNDIPVLLISLALYSSISKKIVFSK